MKRSRIHRNQTSLDQLLLEGAPRGVAAGAVSLGAVHGARSSKSTASAGERISSEHRSAAWLMDDSQTALETAIAAVPQVNTRSGTVRMVRDSESLGGTT